MFLTRRYVYKEQYIFSPKISLRQLVNPDATENHHTDLEKAFLEKVIWKTLIFLKQTAVLIY